MVAALRYLTLLWPGMPWLWLRGSRAGLLLAIAFAVVLDTAILTTWIWSDLVDAGVPIGLWAAAAAVWIIAGVSALSAFPTPLQTRRNAANDGLFVEARDAYLARDWLKAETKLRSLLAVAPTDGEAQLLLATLLRRAGRLTEARTALEKLARSDSGAGWASAIARERARITAVAGRSAETKADPKTDAGPEPAILAIDRPTAEGEPDSVAA